MVFGSVFLPLTTVTGVVIGETTVIGLITWKIYQEVTLGALSVEKLKRDTSDIHHRDHVFIMLVRRSLGGTNTIC